MDNIIISRVESFVFRAPITNPVKTSFGVMTDRPAVLVRIEDADGAAGWGEIWCNFPACGAEHRAKLIDTVMAPLLLGRRFSSPGTASRALETGTRILTIQTGERGPFAQVVAGIDIAFWDLASRRVGLPVCVALGRAASAVPVYASGIHPNGAVETLKDCRTEGHKAFKLKIGFDEGQDLETVRAVTSGLQPDERLMLDANQAWDLKTALHMVKALAPFAPDWLEEPLPADEPIVDWHTLSKAASFPLAGGENLLASHDFDRIITSGVLGVIQPDACKWGGLSGGRVVAKATMAAGHRYCPHYLGGGIGLVASAHLLAAVGGDGLLEVDVNPNPLRNLLAEPFPKITDGHLRLTDGIGLGVEPDLKNVRKWLVHHEESY